MDLKNAEKCKLEREIEKKSCDQYLDKERAQKQNWNWELKKTLGNIRNIRKTQDWGKY